MSFTFDDLKELLVVHGKADPAAVVNDPQLNIEELGVGSMGMLAMQLDLQMRLGVSLGLDDLPQLKTLEGFLALVNARLPK
jgi:acyl carrier protein